VKWEFSFDTLAGNDASNGEHFSRARAAYRDKEPTENQNPFFGALQYFSVHNNPISNFKFAHIFIEIRALNIIEYFLAHRLNSLKFVSVNQSAHLFSYQ
jgi:hypothetical protein